MSRRVLLVEDSDAMRSMMAVILEEALSLEVVGVASGLEALQQLPRGPWSLIVSDLNMPLLNGLELLRYVREHPEHGAARFLLVSTSRSREDWERARGLGADAFLAKPFQDDDLVAEVRRLIGDEPEGP